MLAVNLTGTFHCVHAALPDMLASGWGCTVNVVGTVDLTGYEDVSAYCAAKYGVSGLTRSLALEVATKTNWLAAGKRPLERHLGQRPPGLHEGDSAGCGIDRGPGEGGDRDYGGCGE